MDPKQSAMNPDRSTDGGLNEQNIESNADINQGPKARHKKINNNKPPLAMCPPNTKQGSWIHTIYSRQFKNTPVSSGGRTSISQNAEGVKPGSTKLRDSKKHSSDNLQYQDISVEQLLREATNRMSLHHSEATQLHCVPRHFKSVDEYVRVFETLLFDVMWAHLKNAWEELAETGSRDVHTLVRVKTVERCERGWYDVILLSEHECKWAFKEDEVAVLSTRRPGADKSFKRNINVDLNEDTMPQHVRWVAGTVRRYIPNDTRYPSGAVVHFYVGDSDDFRRPGDDHVLREFQSKSIWYMTVLGTLSTILSEYNAVHAFRHFNLQPTPERFPKYEEQPPAMPECSFTPNFLNHLHRTFNGSQLSAIQWAARHAASGIGGRAAETQEPWPFTLVQAPIGTGKTHTVWGMLNVIHLVQHQQYYTALLKKLTSESYKQAINSSSRSISSGSIDDVMRSVDQDIFRSLPKLCSKARILVCAPSDAARDKLLARVLGRGFIDGELNVYSPEISSVGVISQNQAAQVVSVERRTNAFLLKSRDEVMGLLHQLKALELQYLQKIFYLQRELNVAVAADHSPDSVRVVPGFLSARDHNRDLLLHNLTAVVEEREKVMVEISRLIILENRFRSGGGFNVDDARASLEASFLNEAEIVFTTLSNSGLSILSRLAHGFDMIVIDDAAQTSELALLPALLLCSGRCILVGDLQQLPAAVNTKASGISAYRRSLFERFRQACCPTLLLSVKYRIHTQIQDFPSRESQACLIECESANLVNEIYPRSSSCPCFLRSYTSKVQASMQSHTPATGSQPVSQSGSSAVDIQTTSDKAPVRSSHAAEQRPLASGRSPQTVGGATENIRNPDEESTSKDLQSLAVSFFCSFFPAILLGIHIIVGSLVMHFHSSAFSRGETFCDAIYFSTVATCTIGYGDFIPLTCGVKAFTSVYLLIARIIMVFFGMKISDWLQILEKKILESFLLTVPQDQSPHHFFIQFLHDEDDEYRVLRDIMIKVVSAIIYSVVVIVIGICLSLKKNVAVGDVGDAIYFAIVSVTTTGFGDETFKEKRCLASLWLLISTCITDRLFALLLEVLLDRRSRKKANSVFRTPLNKEELKRTNVRCDSKYDVLVYVLKKMKRIGERELRLFNRVFIKLQTEDNL